MTMFGLQITFCLLSLLQTCSVWAAGSTADIAAANLALQATANQADQDVVAFNLLCGLTEALQIPNDIQILNTDIHTVIQNNTGAAPTSDAKTEDAITGSFANFTNTLAQYMSDLQSKATVLTTFGQKQAIYSQLVDLSSAYVGYSEFLREILGDQDHQEDIDQALETGVDAVQSVENVYAPAVTSMSG